VAQVTLGFLKVANAFERRLPNSVLLSRQAKYVAEVVFNELAAAKC